VRSLLVKPALEISDALLSRESGFWAVFAVRRRSLSSLTYTIYDNRTIKYNINMNLQETESTSVEWIYLTHDTNAGAGLAQAV
jgi:hypothetical protein